MSVPMSHAFRQGRGIRSLLQVGLSAMTGVGPPLPELRPVMTETIGPTDNRMVDDAIRWAGGDPKKHPDTLPPWLFAWWGIRCLRRAAHDRVHPALKIVNQALRSTTGIIYRVVRISNSPLASWGSARSRQDPSPPAIRPARQRCRKRRWSTCIRSCRRSLRRDAASQASGPGCGGCGLAEVAEWENRASAGSELRGSPATSTPSTGFPSGSARQWIQVLHPPWLRIAARGLEHLARYRWAEGMDALRGWMRASLPAHPARQGPFFLARPRRRTRPVGALPSAAPPAARHS